MVVIMNGIMIFLHSCMYLKMFICNGNSIFMSMHKNNYKNGLKQSTKCSNTERAITERDSDWDAKDLWKNIYKIFTLRNYIQFAK